MLFAQPNTQIHYTLDGTMPTRQSTLYTGPINITEGFTKVSERVFGADFLPSEVTEAFFIKNGLPVQSVEGTLPHDSYKGSGAATLIDNKGGDTGFSGHTWLGFQRDTVDLVLHLKKKTKVKSVLVNLLRSYGSWIFLPEKIEIYAQDSKSKTFQLIDQQSFIQESDIPGSSCVPAIFSLKSGVKTDTIRVRLYLVNPLPDWHPGKGNKSWIFVDEIKVY